MKGQHFLKLIGFKLGDVSPGRVTGVLDLEEKHLQQHGFAHGGLIATLLDVVMGFSSYSLVTAEQGVVTANLSIDFVNPGLGNLIQAEGWVYKAGGKLHFCSAELHAISGEKRTLIASGRSVMAIIEGG
jgi:uncharacterized protein (TIGR00369 family)